MFIESFVSVFVCFVCFCFFLAISIKDRMKSSFHIFGSFNPLWVSTIIFSVNPPRLDGVLFVQPLMDHAQSFVFELDFFFSFLFEFIQTNLRELIDLCVCVFFPKNSCLPGWRSSGGSV